MDWRKSETLEAWTCLAIVTPSHGEYELYARCGTDSAYRYFPSSATAKQYAEFLAISLDAQTWTTALENTDAITGYSDSVLGMLADLSANCLPIETGRM
jgi:hypothetical protein